MAIYNNLNSHDLYKMFRWISLSNDRSFMWLCKIATAVKRMTSHVHYNDKNERKLYFLLPIYNYQPQYQFFFTLFPENNSFRQRKKKSNMAFTQLSLTQHYSRIFFLSEVIYIYICFVVEWTTCFYIVYKF